jgi:Protein of unknown function (DUF1488)
MTVILKEHMLFFRRSAAMAEQIIFPRFPPARWVFDRDCVEFPAKRGDEKYRCLASLELLYERFGARFDNVTGQDQIMLRTYEMSRERLQQIAKAQILAGKVVKGNEVQLTTDTYAFEDVKFSESARENSYCFGQIRLITGDLEQVLGTSASFVIVEWDRIKDAAGRVLYTLAIQDFSGRVSIAFTPAQLVHSTETQMQLYRLWGDLLQERNHKQLQELLGAGKPEE